MLLSSPGKRRQFLSKKSLDQFSLARSLCFDTQTSPVSLFSVFQCHRAQPQSSILASTSSALPVIECKHVSVPQKRRDRRPLLGVHSTVFVLAAKSCRSAGSPFQKPSRWQTSKFVDTGTHKVDVTDGSRPCWTWRCVGLAGNHRYSSLA